MKKTREEEIMNKEKEVREMQRLKFGPEGSLFKKREERGKGKKKKGGGGKDMGMRKKWRKNGREKDKR